METLQLIFLMIQICCLPSPGFNISQFNVKLLLHSRWFLLPRSVQLNCLWRYDLPSDDHMTVTDCRGCLTLSWNIFFKLDVDIEFILHNKNNFPCSCCCTINTVSLSWIIMSHSADQQLMMPLGVWCFNWLNSLLHNVFTLVWFPSVMIKHYGHLSASSNDLQW